MYQIPEKSEEKPLETGTQHDTISEQESKFLARQADKLWQEKQGRITHLKNYNRKLQRCEKNFNRSKAQLRSVITKIKSRPVTAIIRKTTPLTEPEENYLKQHTKYSLDLANLTDDFPSGAKPILFQHHEHLDGTGYPKQTKGEQIDLKAQLVAVINAYDNICHPQDPSKAKIPYSALSHLFKHCKAQYNNDYLTLLIRLLGVYPPGSVVQLSNQQLGLVISVNSNSLLHPNVLLYDPSVPSNETPIIVLEENNLRIEQAIPPHKLPEKVYAYLNPRIRVSYYFDPDD